MTDTPGDAEAAYVPSSDAPVDDFEEWLRQEFQRYMDAATDEWVEKNLIGTGNFEPVGILNVPRKAGVGGHTAPLLLMHSDDYNYLKGLERPDVADVQTGPRDLSLLFDGLHAWRAPVLPAKYRYDRSEEAR